MEDPQITQAGLAGSGSQIPDWSLVGLQVAALKQAVVDALVERLEPEDGKLRPAAHRVAANLHAVAGG